MKKLFWMCLLLLPGITLSGQSVPVYRLDSLGDGIAGAVALGFGLGMQRVADNIVGPDEAFLAGLDPMDVNAFDRPATARWSPAASTASDWTMYTAGFGAIAGMLLDRQMRSSWGTWTVMFFETFLINHGLTFVTKTQTRRVRPLAYNPTVPAERKARGDVFQSFYSGHTSFTAAAAFLAAKIYHDHHRDSKWRFLAWSGAGILTGATAYLRVAGGKHYPTDVIVGAGAGALVGILVPEFHRVRKAPDQRSELQWELGPALGMQGVRLGLRF
ncbi:MAG: phosphatase PAP2 family protein [Bacteroidota bacterium]